MKIERPIWMTELSEANGIEVEVFDLWFDQNVEPINKLLSEAVEYYAATDHSDEILPQALYLADSGPITHKALVINIEPIKKETAEDILRYMVNKYEATGNDVFYPELYNRAKAVLDNTIGKHDNKAEPIGEPIPYSFAATNLQNYHETAKGICTFCGNDTSLICKHGFCMSCGCSAYCWLD